MRIAIGLLTATVLAGPGVAAAPAWIISEASPGVMVSHAGLVKTASRGGKAEAGDIISTSANARAVLVRGEEYAVVAPNSRLQIADTSAGGEFTQFLEKIGNVVFSVKKMTTPHFGVQTPYLAAVVKGTTFSVTVDDSGASVQVVEGAVEVATKDGGARDLLHPGNIASVTASDPAALTIQGTTTRTIRSSIPVAATQAPVKPAAIAGTDDRSAGGGITAVTLASAPHANSSIVSVEEPSSDLSALSGGLVSGQTATQVAVASSNASASDTAVALATDKPTAPGRTGNPTGSGSGSGKNGASGSTGSGNSSGLGGAGNGNGGATGSGNNGNGGGTGSGNNGNGNGNGGGTGSGNNGNGSGNGGGNGSGNNGSGNGNGGGKGGKS